MTGAGGAAGGAPADRSPRPFDVLVELSAVVAVVLVVGLSLVRGQAFAGSSASALRPLVPVLSLSLLALLTIRALRSRHHGPIRPSPRAWLPALGVPELILLAVLLGLLVGLPEPARAIGADGRSYLQQLGGHFLRGAPGTHPGVEPGASLMWAPFFGLGHAVALGAEAAGFDVATDGASAPYRNALRLGALVYGFLAAIFAQRAAARFVTPLLAAVCAAAFWLGSPLFHYTVAEPVMAHAPAAAVSALLLLLWLRAREAPERAGRWLALGVVGGLLVTVQRYDAYLLLPAALAAASTARSRWRTGDRVSRRRTLQVAGATAVLFLLATLPLALLAFASPHGFLLSPESIRTQMLADWSRPHVVPLLFSSNGGLFAWTPLALPAVAGIALLARRDRAVGLALLLTLAVGVYVLASNPIWWAGWSFGARRLTEAYPIFVLGLAVFADAALRRPALLGLALLGLFVLQGMLSSVQVRRGRVPQGDAVSLLAVLQGSIRDAHSVVGHPGSWPANWLFAWQHGVSPGRFDELFGRVPRESWSVALGQPGDAAVVGRGWSDPWARGGRWAVEDETTLLVTLTAPADRRIRIHAAAAPHPDGYGQAVTVLVNGRRAGVVALAPRGRSWEAAAPAGLWREGLNEIRFRGAWRLSRSEAWAAETPAYAGWRLESFSVEPAP